MKFNLPTLDKSLLKMLCEECDIIESNLEKKLDVSNQLQIFNVKISRQTDSESIGSYHSYTSQEDFIRSLLLPKVEKDPSINKDEFIELISKVMKAEGEESEINYWLEILSINLSSDISDMIFWPEDEVELSASDIYEKAKQQ